jgi:hypothetical protein
MKKKILLLLLAAVITCPLSAQMEVTVTNAKEFVKAIGPERTIIMQAGTYMLNDAVGISTEHVSWNEQFDGSELVITSANNMTIKAKGKVSIIATPRYAWVMMFYYSDNVTIDGLTAGHLESGYCTGGVFGFDHCRNFEISNSDLYGSGTEGISASQCDNFSITNCVIHDCTYDLISLYNSGNFSFNSCKFLKTGEFDLVTLSDCKNISFTKCTFTENFNGDFMPYLFSVMSSENVSLTKCRIFNNKVRKFTNDIHALKISSCKFSGNNFMDYTDDYLSKKK